MKRKLIKRNKAFLSKCIKDAKGWPLYLFLYDRYSKMSVMETRYHRKLPPLQEGVCHEAVANLVQ